MENQFLRTEMMFGREAMDQLGQCHVAVFGLGGVGSFAVEALARAGVGEVTLVDHDTIGATNLNRQLGALHSTLGMLKADAMKQRVLDINPACIVHSLPEYYSADTRHLFFETPYDYIIDAIDLVSCKLDLIQTSLEMKIPIISSMGTGNKLDPTAFRIADISKTEGCPLARILRKELRHRGIHHHKVLYSPELPVEPLPLETPPPGRRSIPASVSWVPSCAGLMLAGSVIKELVEDCPRTTAE